MHLVGEATDGATLIRRALWGRSRSVSNRAIVLAVTLFIVVAIVRYAIMAFSEDIIYFDIGRGSLDPTLLWGINLAFEHPGLIVGLAAIHAYLNEGYLPAVLLAVAPTIGMTIWIYSGPYPGPYVLTWKPLVGNWGWVSVVIRFALPWATFGFLVGFVVRWLRTQVLDLSEPM